MSGSGQCQCHARFTGTACELCAPGAFGPQCEGGPSCCLPSTRPALPCPLGPGAPTPTPSSCLSLSPACHCTSHGRCDEGLGGSGSCFCEEGWTGPSCEVQLSECPLRLCPPCMLVPACGHRGVPRLHTQAEALAGCGGARGIQEGSSSPGCVGCALGGQSCSLCVPRPAHPRPCAAQTTAVSAAWAMKGMDARAQVSSGWDVRRESPPPPAPPVPRSCHSLPAPSGGPVPGRAWWLQRARQLQPSGHRGHLCLPACLRGRRLEMPGPRPLCGWPPRGLQ